MDFRAAHSETFLFDTGATVSIIPPYHAARPYDIPFHLREPANAKSREMLRSGVLTETTEATDWCSQSFPVQKTNSDPAKCRWVTAFRNLNIALKRHVWGGESSYQLLRHMNPKAKYFTCFDAISGYHQIRVNDESSKLLNIITQMGNYRFTVLGQGICSSQDLFNFITDRGTKLDEDFNCLKNIDDFLLFSDTLEGLEIQIKKSQACTLKIHSI